MGIDIGATCSAVSFIHLTRGKKPEIQRVTKWPGQEGAQTECRLPSWILYNSRGKPAKYGAEAARLDAEEGDDHGYQRAKHFKLHLHPKDMKPASGLQAQPLPHGVTIQQVYTDYFRFLYTHAQTFFCEPKLRGQEIWQSLNSSLEIIIAHPNGWGTREQGVLRSAAVAAGLATAGNFDRRVSFVSEAEASVQFCLNLPSTTAGLRSGMKIVVCDAGGSTVDTTVYKIASMSPMLELEEVKASACIQAGGIFVDSAAESYLRGRFQSANLDNDDVDTYTQDGVDYFTRTTKLSFDGTGQSYNVKVGKRRLNKPSINLQSGFMKLPVKTVKNIFDTCVEPILGSVSQQSVGVDSPYYFLVGGFGDNPYLKSEMLRHFMITNRLITKNEPGAKAVADGAAIWAVARSVVSRAARYSFGVPIYDPYDSDDEEHTGREPFFTPAEELCVNGVWSEIVAKDTVMSSESSLKKPYCRQYRTQSEAPRILSVRLYATSLLWTPTFMYDKDDSVSKGWQNVCDVKADLQEVNRCMVKKRGLITGATYWQQDYQVYIQFGGTQLSAYIEWTHNGQTMTSPATIIPPDFA